MAQCSEHFSMDQLCRRYPLDHERHGSLTPFRPVALFHDLTPCRHFCLIAARRSRHNMPPWREAKVACL
jgi:hypothetical protein